MRQVALHYSVQFPRVFLSHEEGDLTRCAWRGEVDLPGTDDEALHILWAYFQNDMLIESSNDQAFVERIEEIRGDFKDRSLCAGDVIVLDGTAYAVELMGFKPVAAPVSLNEDVKGPENDTAIIEAQARNQGVTVKHIVHRPETT